MSHPFETYYTSRFSNKVRSLMSFDGDEAQSLLKKTEGWAIFDRERMKRKPRNTKPMFTFSHTGDAVFNSYLDKVCHLLKKLGGKDAEDAIRLKKDAPYLIGGYVQAEKDPSGATIGMAFVVDIQDDRVYTGAFENT